MTSCNATISDSSASTRPYAAAAEGGAKGSKGSAGLGEIGGINLTLTLTPASIFHKLNPSRPPLLSCAGSLLPPSSRPSTCAGSLDVYSIPRAVASFSYSLTYTHIGHTCSSNTHRVRTRTNVCVREWYREKGLVVLPTYTSCGNPRHSTTQLSVSSAPIPPLPGMHISAQHHLLLLFASNLPSLHNHCTITAPSLHHHCR